MAPPTSTIPRFEVWTASLPHEEGTHVTSGPRPCIVVADVPGNRFCIVLPMTTRLDRVNFTATHRIEASPANGLSQPSVALVFQIRYLDREKLQKRLGLLSPEDQAIVDGLLADLLGFGG